jgi:pimeloyl-ACP methyl ester carboxylesterase
VFLGGTRAAGFLGGDEPWDMTSNLHAVAERSPGSRRAAEEAMRRSGMTAESEVVFTGYSQGGLLATQLAASGDWNAQGLVTFGAPVGGLDLPETFPAVQIEHTDDLVPAFGGDRTDLGPVVVRREAFAGRDVPPDVAVPAHRLAEYRSTAELLDEARSPTVERSAARLHAVGSGAERVEVTYYRADRVPGRD